VGERRITEKQKRNGMRWCGKCLGQGKKVEAMFREWGGELTCPEHHISHREESTDYSEADYATWLRL
jgi:hypothetical protein